MIPATSPEPSHQPHQNHVPGPNEDGARGFPLLNHHHVTANSVNLKRTTNFQKQACQSKKPPSQSRDRSHRLLVPRHTVVVSMFETLSDESFNQPRGGHSTQSAQGEQRPNELNEPDFFLFGVEGTRVLGVIGAEQMERVLSEAVWKPLQLKNLNSDFWVRLYPP
eukprot:c20052_g1_i4.p2 GENE.c20052_g1_i4~~c20052_g1_i4.p2  ORF type:complete len:165 (+),score=12.67 c20052_g1_i4:173-667(+)